MMGDERELLTTRAKYPESSGWEKIQVWIFSPSSESQLRIGIEQLLESNLVAEFVKHAGKDPDAELVVAPKQYDYQWSRYRKVLERIARSTDQELLARLLWSIFSWANTNSPMERTRFLREAIDPIELIQLFNTKGLLKSLLIALIDEDNSPEA